MYYLKTYKNVQSARVALQASLKAKGFALRDVSYEVKTIRGTGRFHIVLDQNANGKRLLTSLEREGFVVTHN